MIGVIGIALSILVILGGLYLLAKSKKDALGNLYIFSSYSAIALGALLFVGTIVGGACMMRSHHSNGHSSCFVKGHGSSCGQASSCTKGNSQCNSHQKSCSSKSECKGSSRGYHGAEASCGHHGSSFGKHHGDKKCKKISREYHHEGNDDVDEEIEVQVEVEVEEVVD